MAIDPNLRQHVVSWLKSKCKTGDCPLCGANDWHVEDTHAVPVLHGQALVATQAMPLAALTCNNCCYVMFFAAKRMGLPAAPTP
jgi:hypothetical protein